MQKELGLKLLIIFLLGVLVLVPVAMVKHKIHERENFQHQASAAVSRSWTGEQVLVTPILVTPYQLSVQDQSGFIREGELGPVEKLSYLWPGKLAVNAEVQSRSVYKGIYEVPVYNSRVTIAGSFGEEQLRRHLERLERSRGFRELGEPFIVLCVSDMRGIDRTPKLLLNQESVALEPGSALGPLTGGVHVSLGDRAALERTIDFKLDLSLKGMGSLSFVPLADAASVEVGGNWPHPEFVGASLPDQRDISEAGFTASWVTSRYSVPAGGLLDTCLNEHNCVDLLNSSSGVRFIDPVDVYLQSERSVKYAILFIGLSFITFFMFENIARLPIHPIQYAFVGLAIAVFYLLLISLAEHIAFHWAYAIAALCCSGLILVYVVHILRSLRAAALFSAMISALYGVLYVIVGAEDYALLMGSILVFGVLAVLMYVTRRVDWYAMGDAKLEGT